MAKSTEEIAAIGFARRYSFLVEQDLFHLASLCAPYYHSQSPRREWAPRLVSRFCVQLFRRADPKSLSVIVPPKIADSPIRSLATDLSARAQQIATDFAGLNRSFHWDFYFFQGRRLDPDWQEAWGSCADEAQSKFLVAPALIFNGELYVRQKVYTRSRRRNSKKA